MSAAARWRYTKPRTSNSRELWRGETWLAYVREIKLRSGKSVWTWGLVNRDECGHEDLRLDAEKAAREALREAEDGEHASAVRAEAEHGS